MIKKYKLGLALGLALSVGVVSTVVLTNNHPEEQTNIPENVEYEHEEEYNEELHNAKMAPWTTEDAKRQRAELQKFSRRRGNRTTGSVSSYGSLKGTWANKAPRNMPGAFKFAEMLDGTDIIYGVTHNHYVAEYNAKSYIFKGTVYNPKTGTKGDDFVRLTGHWPNRYNSLIAHKFNGQVRLIADIENGSVYYSDNEGQDWIEATGLPTVVQSVALNRQDELVYATDGGKVYVSTDGAISFTELQSIGSAGDATLYSPRYDVQPDAEKVYLAREGKFYELNGAKTSFTLKGSFANANGRKSFSIGGDSRKLYVTEDNSYWVSTNGGTSWTQKFPKGNWYGDRGGKMSAGKFIGVSPENPDFVMGGYAQPVYSKDGLNTDNSTDAGWGRYQNGGNLGLEDYIDRIRFNYHPDFQAQQFFYNSTGDLFSVGSTDGGLFISYKVWEDHPIDGDGKSYDNTGYQNAHFININTLSTPCALIYRHNMFTGYKDPNHIVFSTQDQGTQDYILGTTGDTLNVYQTIGGDGPPLNSADGNWVWKWKRQGSQVWMPYQLYDQNGNRRKIGTVSNAIGSQQSVTFTQSTRVGWVQAYIDRDEPSKRIWMLNRSLSRAEVNGSSLSGTTVSKGTGHQVCAFTQATQNPEIVFFLQEGKVYKSTNRGDTWDNGTSTPFTKTVNNQNMGAGWVLPENDNWILFAGPSANGVGAILSKDGGATWTDITGDFTSGDDFQVGGMVGTPDGKYVFAGTDVGPYVFVVAEEKWYPLFADRNVAMFNTTAIEYIESINTVRFGTWGSGVWDFTIDNGTLPLVTFTSPDNGTSLEMRTFEAITLKANASDQDGTIDRVYFEVQGQQIEASLSGGEYVANWTPNAYGTFKVKVYAVDNDGLDTFEEIEITITEPLLSKNLELTSVNRTNNTSCTTSLGLEIEVTNRGSSLVSSFDIKTYLNGSLKKTTTKQVALATDEKTTVTLDMVEISNSGEQEVSVEVVLDGDEKIENTELTKTYTVELGAPYQFYISTRSKNPSLTWDVLDGQGQVIADETTEESTEGGLTVQNFCLADGCFDIEVSDAFTTGGCDAEPWVATKAYSGGAVVSYNGKKYTASYYSLGSNPEENNGQFGKPWLLPTECSITYDNDVLGVKNLATNTNEFEVTVANFTNTVTEQVCAEVVTNQVTATGVKVQAYPNPFTNQITIAGVSEGTVSIYNQVGTKVLSQAFAKSINTENLPKGAYVLVVESKGNKYQFKLVK